MDCISFGLEREERIRGFVCVFPYLTTSVILRQHFCGRSAYRKCAQVLQRMVKKGLLNRFKHGHEYVYHIGKKTTQWLHTHMVTMFYFELMDYLQESYKIFYYKRELEYLNGRADGFYIITTNKGNGVKFFLEYDDMRNEFDKTQKYEEYFKSMLWKQEWWADPFKKGIYSFPIVLVVTTRSVPNSNIIKLVTCKPGENYMEALLNGK